MTRSKTRAPAIACSLLALVMASSVQAEPLAATSEWQVRSMDYKCRLARTFGSGEDAISLWIEQSVVEKSFNVTLIGEHFANPYNGRIKVRFGQERGYERGHITTTSSKGRPVISMFGVLLAGREDPTASIGKGNLAVSDERRDAITTVTFDAHAGKPVTLEIGPMAKPLKDLADCNASPREEPEDTAPEKQASSDMSRGARADGQGKWAPQIMLDYPVAMIRRGLEGTAGVTVVVDQNGKVVQCEVNELIGPGDFADAACLGMRKYSRFQPARDANGKPTLGTYTTTVVYRFNR